MTPVVCYDRAGERRKVRFEMPGRRVLVVEDEYFIAMEVAKALQNKGVETVGPVRSVRDALTIVERNGLDAAILDINLNNEPVFPLAEALEARKVPFVFATGYGAHAIPQRFQHIPRFEKPLNLNQLLKAVLPN
jgi:DNA-binding NtrC family response regulator